jgi:PX domain
VDLQFHDLKWFVTVRYSTLFELNRKVRSHCTCMLHAPHRTTHDLLSQISFLFLSYLSFCLIVCIVAHLSLSLFLSLSLYSRQLREKYERKPAESRALSALSFPPKRYVSVNTVQFIRKRRHQLQEYLRHLLALPFIPLVGVFPSPC